MKLRAIDQRILVEVNTIHIDKAFAGSVIEMPDEFMAKQEGGCQVFTVLDVGSAAFDTAPPDVQDIDWVGRSVITCRYPGTTIDFDPKSTDQTLSRYRMINWEEIGMLIANDDEPGIEVEIDNE